MSDDTTQPAAEQDLPQVERSSLLTDDPLKKHFDAVQAEIDRIEAQTKPLREQRDALQAKLQPIEDAMRSLARRFNHIERTAGLFELKNQLGGLAKAMGGRSMSEGTEQPEETGETEQSTEQGETVDTINYGEQDQGTQQT
jgi:uncharacterized small protein (DUF1192 family)